MKFTFLPTQNRQKYLLWGLGAIVFIMVVVVWYGYFREETISIFQSKAPPPPQEIILNFGIFEHPVFQELGIPSDEILLPEPTERANPFILTQ